MSQIFSKDAQSNSNAPVLPPAGLQTQIQTNPLTPPFGNCKAVIKATINVTPNAAATGIVMTIYRNIDSDFVDVLDVFAYFSAPSGYIQVTGMATDEIPDGRDVTYTLQAEQIGAAGPSGGFVSTAFIEAELISG